MAVAPSTIRRRRERGVTVAEYMSMPDDGQKYELFEGELLMSPSYIFGHGSGSVYVLSKLHAFVSRRGLGLVGQETDVVMKEFNTVLRPDICFIAKHRISIIRGHIYGPPDLVIEFTSPANRERDLYEKRDLYERFGVREYWVFDIAERRNQAYQWFMKRGIFHGGLVSAPSIRSHVVKGFSLRLRDVWNAAAVGQ